MYLYLEIHHTVFIKKPLLILYNVTKKILLAMEVNLYLKVFLHRLIATFKESANQSVNRGMCLYLEIKFFSQETYFDLS